MPRLAGPADGLRFQQLAIEIIQCRSDVIQAEKLTAEEIARLVARMKAMGSVWNRPVVAAAGGIHAGNVAAHAQAGADIIVTSSPYSARSCNVQVQIEPAGVARQLVSDAA